MNYKAFATIGCLVLSGLVVCGQKAEYRIVSRSFQDNGNAGVHLGEADGVGIAWIKGVSFNEGTIELDIKGRDVLQRSFVGFVFHGVNDSTYEAVYFRPFNFRNPDPERKVHAVQYIANPEYDWPVLREKFHNKYEQPVSPVPDPTGWFHVKMNVTKEKIEVFVDGSATPSLVVAPPLVQRNGRQAGFWVGNGSDGDFKNLRITYAK